MIRGLYRVSSIAALLLLGGILGAWLSDGILDLKRMFLPPAPKTEAAAAWDDFAARIGALGKRILREDFPSGNDRDRAAGIEHLAQMLVEGLRWEFDHGSAEPASLLISNTDSTAWGAPNVDNKYYRARIDPASTYTLTGNVASVHEIAIQTSRGDMHQGYVDTSETVDLSGLTLDAEGNFSLEIGPEPTPGDWLQPAAEHTILGVRLYLVDWESDAAGALYLSEDGAEGLAPEPLSEAEAAARLGRAASWIEANVVGWNRWFNTLLLSADTNEPLAPRFVAGGSSTLLYGGIPSDLPAGMALVIEVDDPEADYFSFQTYHRGWYKPGDFANRQTSLNQQQTHVGSDGKIRFVASAEDPGVPNWLDTEGQTDALIVFRYIQANNPQLPTVHLVSQREVRSLLPDDTPRVSADERRATIAMRQRHVQRRYHN